VTDTTDESAFTSEDAQVLRHRIRRFEQLGFSEQEAVQLGESEVDYRRAGELLTKGCPKQVVLRILL